MIWFDLICVRWFMNSWSMFTLSRLAASRNSQMASTCVRTFRTTTARNTRSASLSAHVSGRQRSTCPSTLGHTSLWRSASRQGWSWWSTVSWRRLTWRAPSVSTSKPFSSSLPTSSWASPTTCRSTQRRLQWPSGMWRTLTSSTRRPNATPSSVGHPSSSLAAAAAAALASFILSERSLQTVTVRPTIKIGLHDTKYKFAVFQIPKRSCLWFVFVGLFDMQAEVILCGRPNKPH